MARTCARNAGCGAMPSHRLRRVGGAPRGREIHGDQLPRGIVDGGTKGLGRVELTDHVVVRVRDRKLRSKTSMPAGSKTSRTVTLAAAFSHALGWWRVTSPAPRLLFSVCLARRAGARLALQWCRKAKSPKCLKCEKNFSRIQNLKTSKSRTAFF